MRVRFIETDTPYEAGEVYELPEPVAEKMIRHGVAEPTEAGALKAEPDELEDED